MPKTTALATSPDYSGLVKFLIHPLLDSPQALSIDCEESNNNQRVWVRLAFEGTDKGRVFGRSGRNIQAIRTILNTAATAAGQSLYLDIYESDKISKQSPASNSTEKEGLRKSRSSPTNFSKPSVKPRLQ